MGNDNKFYEDFRAKIYSVKAEVVVYEEDPVPEAFTVTGLEDDLSFLSSIFSEQDLEKALQYDIWPPGGIIKTDHYLQFSKIRTFSNSKFCQLFIQDGNIEVKVDTYGLIFSETWVAERKLFDCQEITIASLIYGYLFSEGDNRMIVKVLLEDQTFISRVRNVPTKS